MRDVLWTGINSLHRCQQFAIVLHKEVQFAKHVIVRIPLSELIQRGLKVVGLHRQVVVVGGDGTLYLVQIGQFAVRIRTSVIHIIT